MIMSILYLPSWAQKNSKGINMIWTEHSFLYLRIFVNWARYRIVKQNEPNWILILYEQPVHPRQAGSSIPLISVPSPRKKSIHYTPLVLQNLVKYCKDRDKNDIKANIPPGPSCPCTPRLRTQSFHTKIPSINPYQININNLLWTTENLKNSQHKKKRTKAKKHSSSLS